MSGEEGEGGMLSNGEVSCGGTPSNTECWQTGQLLREVAQMGGLLVLAPFAEYICGAARLFKRTTSYRAKALVVVAEILLPTADAATNGA